MNTLACIAGLLTSGWLAQHFFVTKDEPLLGFAAIVVFALLIAMTWLALEEDREILSGR